MLKIWGVKKLSLMFVFGTILLVLPSIVIAGAFPGQLCQEGFTPDSKISGPSIIMELIVIKDSSVEGIVKCGGKVDIVRDYDFFESVLTVLDAYLEKDITFETVEAEDFLGFDFLGGTFIDGGVPECEFCAENCSYPVQSAPYLYHIDEETIEMKLVIKIRDYNCIPN